MPVDFQTNTVFEKVLHRIRVINPRENDRRRRVFPFDFFLIFTTSVFIGLLFNSVSPNGIRVLPVCWSEPSPDHVSAYEANWLINRQEALVVDARPREFYKEKHIENAINVPPSVFDMVYRMKWNEVDPQKDIIVYGRNISRHYDEEVAYRFLYKGHKNVKVLEGGYSTWERYGFAVVK